jgi:hypothetical protein
MSRCKPGSRQDTKQCCAMTFSKLLTPTSHPPYLVTSESHSLRERTIEQLRAPFHLPLWPQYRVQESALLSHVRNVLTLSNQGNVHIVGSWVVTPHSLVGGYHVNAKSANRTVPKPVSQPRRKSDKITTTRTLEHAQRWLYVTHTARPASFHLEHETNLRNVVWLLNPDGDAIRTKPRQKLRKGPVLKLYKQEIMSMLSLFHEIWTHQSQETKVHFNKWHEILRSVPSTEASQKKKKKTTTNISDQN